MADKELGALPAISALLAAALFHGVQDGNSRKVTAQQIADFVKINFGEIFNSQLPTRLRALSTPVTDANAVLETGVYSVSASTTGIPVAAAGVLDAKMYSTSGTGVQTYTRTSVANPDVWYRIRVSGSWGSWSRLAAADSAGVVADTALPARLREFPTFTSDWNDAKASGFYFGGSTTVNTPVQPYSFVGEVIAQSSTYCVQRLTALGISNPANNIFFERQLVNDVWSAWYRRTYGDVSGPGAAVTSRSIAGFAGTSGQAISQLMVTEALSALGPVFGGNPPVPSAAGVGLSDGDFDTITVGGLYTTTGSYANGPHGNPATHAGTLEVYTRYQTGITQIYRSYITATLGFTYRRVGTRSSGTDPFTFSAWARIENSVPGTTVAGDLAQFSDSSGNLGPATIGSPALLGRVSAGTGAVERLTAAQGRQILGGWEFIGAFDLAGKTFVDVIGLGAFLSLKISVFGVLNAAGSTGLRFSEDNGATFNASATEFRATYLDGRFDLNPGSAVGDVGEVSSTWLPFGDHGGDTGWPFVSDGTIHNFNKARNAASVHMARLSTTSARYVRTMANAHSRATAQNALRYITGGPSFQFGTLFLEGIRG
ncbi:hypothetical protein EM858_14600 [Agrobacterium sp. CNPSo 2736]|uniref:pyocin knob domain-containing protein n=1 Tax=Agrobacterium sp. CNPSo 2736 TaxID=2499627 RepID=UPI000FD71514|nr:pyocin knob domain-containing protein [Agrobacterium sp. CNPSo 2736]RVT75673.1 hypothetical protein EM858_14600 [Agrobacterium sp. CNPSo 2736]